MSEVTQVTRMRNEIRYYAKQLSSCIDKRSLLKAYDYSRRSDRLYAYSSIIQDACCSCFRIVNSSLDVKKPVVYGFNGKIWVPLLPMVFENVVRDALVSCVDAGNFLVRSDWVEKQGKIMQYAYDGVSASPLSVNPSVVGFRNGVWDFSDVDAPEYHSFDDRLPVTDLLPYDYDESATCPLWCSFLGMMLPDGDVLKLQKYLGLGVVNRRLMSHKVEDTLWLVGGGANGKSTIQRIVRSVYGYDNISEASLSQLLDRNPDARMRAVLNIEGKIFNLCDEVDIFDITRGSDAFKKLCSGEPQNVRGIGRDIRVARDIPFLIFSMNQFPTNRRMDSAFRRRLVQIDFRCSVREDDIDPELYNKLLGELPGIRNWMIEGYKLLRRDGFMFSHTNDDSLSEANEQYFDIFARRTGIRPSAWAGHDEKPYLVQSQLLYDRYCDFCERNNYTASSHRGMVQDLKRLHFVSQRRAAGIFYEVYSDGEIDFGVKL